MEGAVDTLREFRADAGQLAQVLDGGRLDAAQSAEMAQELPAALWAESTYFLQHRGLARAVAAAAMAFQREAVGLVAYAGDQFQGRGARSGNQRASQVRQVDALAALLARGRAEGGAPASGDGR